MSTPEQENKDLARDLFRAFDTHDKELAMEIFADDVGQRNAGAEWTSGKEAYWAGVERYFIEPFPDFSETVEHVFAEDDMVAVRWRYSGTHEGAEYMGVPPTGEEVSGTGHTHLRVEDGKVQDLWIEWDSNSIFRALGIHPESVEEGRIQRQLMEVLLRVLRHNISNDLNAITGMADLIAAGDVPAEEYAELIRQQAQNLQSSAQKVRDVEQAVVHERPPDTVNLPKVIGSVVAEQRQQHPDAQFEVSIAAGDVSVTSNQDTLSMVLGEAIENATIHNDSSDIEIDIDLSRADDDDYEAIIAIADNGPGIPEHELKPVERGSEDPLEHGSGIGLWAIKWGVEKLNGEVEFEENDSTGSVVKLYLGEMN